VSTRPRRVTWLDGDDVGDRGKPVLIRSAWSSLDETLIKKIWLRCVDGRRKELAGFAPQGRSRTMTFMGALRYDRLAAPCLFYGPINAPMSSKSCFQKIHAIATASMVSAQQMAGGIASFHSRNL